MRPSGVEPGDGRAVGGDQAAREAGRVRDRHLLTQDRADPDLDPVDRARHAQPAMGAHERAQARIASQVPVDHLRVGVEIEHPPHLRDEVDETRTVVDVRAQQQ